MEEWLILAIAYPMLYALTNIIDKFLLEKKIKNFYAYSVIAGLIALLSSIVVGVFAGMPQLSQHIIFFVLLAGISYGIVVLIYFHMLTYAEVSRVMGMVYLFPAFVAVYSRIFLGEQLSPIKYVAILVAIIGTVLLAVEKRKKRWKLTHVFWIMIMYAAILGISDTTNKYLLRSLNYWQAYYLVTFVISIILLLPVLAKRIRRDLLKTVRYAPFILIPQVIAIFAAIVFLKAASLAPISIVSAMGTLQPGFVFIIMLLFSLFAPKILKETTTPGVLIYKILGIACVALGAIILSL